MPIKFPEGISTEMKFLWCEYEKEVKEPEFVEIMLGLGIPVRPNVISKYDIDMLVDNNLADSKRNATPFVIHDPLYTSPFDVKDYRNYSKNYPQCDVYFWTEREHGKKFQIRGWDEWVYSGPTVDLIAKASMAKIIELVKNRIAVYHEYKHRVNDESGNAKDSWLFDIREFPLVARKVNGIWVRSSWTEEEFAPMKKRLALREMDE